MSVLATPTVAPRPRTDTAKQISLVYAGVLVLFALTQLYTFETFVELLRGVSVVDDTVGAYLLAPVIVLAEVFALPFLLRMTLSTAFRYFSMFLSWFVALFWFIVSLRILLAGLPVETVGFLGTLVNLPSGWWAVFVSIGLGIMAAWASWGLWPAKSSES